MSLPYQRKSSFLDTGGIQHALPPSILADLPLRLFFTRTLLLSELHPSIPLVRPLGRPAR